MDAEDAVTRALARTFDLLRRPGAYIEGGNGAYALRLGPDRRRRPAFKFSEAVFEGLLRSTTLKVRTDGGYELAAGAAGPAPDRAGRPSHIAGERDVVEPDGRLSTRRANLGESPIAWLTRRKGADGGAFLTLAEAAAGERLREEFHLAGSVGRLTMAWGATPKTGSGRGPLVEPVERARAAKDRLAKALDAVGPGLREILERVCLAGTALEAAERDLGLPRRAGKAVLKLALSRLAAHYRLG